MAEEAFRSQDAGERGNQTEVATQEVVEEPVRDEEARIRAKYPQAPNARSALAQRRLAQAQSKKFFDSGDYNMAKATLRNSKLKKSGIAEPTASISSDVSSITRAPESDAGEKEAESSSEVKAQAEAEDKIDGLQPSSDANPDAGKTRCVESECEAMNADEAQRVVEHPPPPVLLAGPETVTPPTCVADALATVSLRAAHQRRSVQWPLGSSDFAAAGVFDRDLGFGTRIRPLSSLVEADLPGEQRRRGETTVQWRERDLPGADFESFQADGLAESERQRVLRHRHSTISGTYNGTAHDVLGERMPTALLRGPTPNAVPMRRISLIQQQNRGLLNVS